MSIKHFFNKIKSTSTIDNVTIMYFFIIIGVGISAFGLGRLSVTHNAFSDAGISITESGTTDISSKGSNNGPSQIVSNGGKYVASKNGKLYYTVSCAGANRIAAKNKIWFNTQTEAEQLGYILSSSCK